MSYILEALKKSEQERQRGKVPDLLTIHEELPEEAGRQKVWPYLLAAGVIAANIAVFVLLPKNQADTRLAETKTVTQLPIPSRQPPAGKVKPTETLAPESAPESQTAQIITTDPALKKAPVKTAQRTAAHPPPSPAAIVKAETPPLVAILPESPALPVTSPASPQQPEPIAVATQATISPKPTPRPLVVKKKAAITPAKRPSASARRRIRKKRAPSADLDWLKESETARLSKDKVFTLDELPSSVRSDLPEFNISAHFYAHNPQKRMISLNGSIVRQGQTISQGLRLEEITEDGAIFKYRDIRFKVAVF